MITQESLSELFTPAERLVLQELPTGAQNKQIAKKLGIAPGTVKVHMRAINKKLGVTNRTQAAIKAFYVTYDEQRALDAWAKEFSGPLIVIALRDSDHTGYKEVSHGGQEPMQGEGRVLVREQAAAEPT